MVLDEEEATATDLEADAWTCEDEMAPEEYCSCDDMFDDDWTVADSILDVISATSAEWAEASMVEMDLSWWDAEALLVAEEDLALDTSWDVDVTEVLLPSLDDALMEVDLSSDISLWATAAVVLSLDIVLRLTSGDFWASSWLALRRLDDAAMADSCLLSDEYDADWDERDDDLICCDEATAALCLLSEDEENCCMLEDEATTADDEDEAFMDDEEAAIDAPCSTVPLSTTVPDSLPINNKGVLCSRKALFKILTIN